MSLLELEASDFKDNLKFGDCTLAKLIERTGQVDFKLRKFAHSAKTITSRRQK